MEFKDAVSLLQKSMVYCMSLGSKELFHSNLWAYLIENDHQFIKVFIPTFNFDNYIDEEITVYREKSHRDIAIFLKRKDGLNEHIVIENKIKSLPSAKQLEEYTTLLDGYTFYQGILTGIGNNILDFSKNEKLNGKWTYINYEEISESIRILANNSQSENIVKNIHLINEYCDVLEAINCCLNYYLTNSSGRLDYGCKELYNLRIADVYKKLKGSDFLSFVRKEQGYFESICSKEFFSSRNLSQGFHNGKATLDVRFSNWKDEKTRYKMIGVQLEDNQFRIVVERNLKFEEGKDADYLYNLYKDVWFDDSYNSKLKERTILGYKTTMKARKGKKYDSYLTNNYCFVYQYFDICEENNTYENLLELIKHFMLKASSLLNEI